MRELPKIVGDGAWIDHVEAVAMRAVMRVKRPALLGHVRRRYDRSDRAMRSTRLLREGRLQRSRRRDERKRTERWYFHCLQCAELDEVACSDVVLVQAASVTAEEREDPERSAGRHGSEPRVAREQRVDAADADWRRRRTARRPAPR